MIGVAVLLPFISGFMCYSAGKYKGELRDLMAIGVTGIILIMSVFLLLGDYNLNLDNYFGLGINFTSVGFHGLMAFLTALIWFVTTVFSKEYFQNIHKTNRYYFFMMCTLGATLGVFLSDDLYTTFIFFEIMSFTSYILVIHDENKKAIKAGNLYLGVAVLGGLVTLFGLFLMYYEVGSLNVNEIVLHMSNIEEVDKNKYYFIGSLILFGFMGKAGLFPIHVWLPEAHPVAPAPASGILSCILTKTGIFGILVLSCNIFMYDEKWGMLILNLGTITMVLGAVLAVFSTNLKRIFACSSLSQLGFISVGIGMQCILGSHNAIASTGTILHIVNHSVIKLLLFICAGIIYTDTHKLELNDIKGWGKGREKGKKIVHYIFLVACLGITGVPLVSGYISKTLLHESIVEQIIILEELGVSTFYYTIVEYVFLFSGGLTVAYILKAYITIFWEKDKNENTKNENTVVSKSTSVVLVILSMFPLSMGVLPHLIGGNIAEFGYEFMNSHAPDHAVHYFAFVNLKGAIISFIIGFSIYIVVVKEFLIRDGKHINVIPEGLSLADKVYIPLFTKLLPNILALFARFLAGLTDGIVGILRILIFNDDSGRVVPKEDKYFSTYNDFEGKKAGYSQDFAGGLLLVILGLAVAMVYIAM